MGKYRNTLGDYIMTNPSLTPLNSDARKIPDCIRCLRKKMQTVGAAVFVKVNNEWFLGDFEAETPSEDAEFLFTHLLNIGFPEKLSAASAGMILNDDALIEKTFPGVNKLFAGSALIGTPVSYGAMHGVRVAWREALQPFTNADLEELRCLSKCPEGCC